MNLGIQLVVALAILLAGVAGGIKWHAGQDAIAAQAAAKLQKQADDLKRENEADQRKLADKAAGSQAATLVTINNKLGAAYATISKLTARDCLDPASVGVLNGIGATQTGAAVATPSGNPASAPSTTSPAGGLRWSSSVDLANGYAFCRAQYAEVNGQLNQILDIEDQRNPVK